MDGLLHHAGHPNQILTYIEVICEETLSPDTSVQRAKLKALVKALDLGKDKRINSYTDSS